MFISNYAQSDDPDHNFSKVMLGEPDYSKIVLKTAEFMRERIDIRRTTPSKFDISAMIGYNDAECDTCLLLLDSVGEIKKAAHRLVEI